MRHEPTDPNSTNLGVASDHAASVVAALRRRARRPIDRTVAALTLSVTATLIGGLIVAPGAEGGIPPVKRDAVPAFAPAAERRLASETMVDAPTASEVVQRIDRAWRTRQDLLKLAAALAVQGATLPAARAIEAGDYAAAADRLRELAPYGDRLSLTSRQMLADDLARAAAAISDDGADLAEAARDAASVLWRDDTTAERELLLLGHAIERAGAAVPPQPELVTLMRRANLSKVTLSAPRVDPPFLQHRPATGEPPRAFAASPASVGSPPDSAFVPWLGPEGVVRFATARRTVDWGAMSWCGSVQVEHGVEIAVFRPFTDDPPRPRRLDAAAIEDREVTAESDGNRVPAPYRAIVAAYFSDEEG